MKQEPKSETKPDSLLTFDEFLSLNAESKLIKEYSGFFFSTSKQAPRFNGKSLYLDVHGLQLLKILSSYYSADNQKNLLRMLEARGRKRSGRRAKRKHSDGPGHISLRCVDYFFTNYSKTCHLIINGRMPMQEYDRLLSFHTKQRFDMFSRRRLLFFRHPITECWMATSVRQLNFFKFYLESGVWAYIQSILPQLQQHMSNTMRQARKARKARQTRKKRKGIGDIGGGDGEDGERRRVPLIPFNAKCFGVVTETAAADPVDPAETAVEQGRPASPDTVISSLK
jgi:hypothetical protein